MTYNPALRQHVLRGSFPYTSIPEMLPENDVLAYRDRAVRHAIELAKSWSPQANSEWLVRNYLAAKLLLASGVFLASERYAEGKGLVITRPYLIYYGMFQACRALLLTIPSVEWRGGDLFDATHQKVINSTIDELKRLRSDLADAVGHRLADARSHRELFSYDFPANGPQAFEEPKAVFSAEAIGIATLLGEIAQLNSEALDDALDRFGPKTPSYDDATLSDVGWYETHNGDVIADKEDHYRIWQLRKNLPRPTNVWCQVREGMIEDFLFGWREPPGREGGFDPDCAWSIVFPFP